MNYKTKTCLNLAREKCFKSKHAMINCWKELKLSRADN